MLVAVMHRQDFLPSADRPGRVLAVDDNPFNHQLLTLQLKAHPFTLSHAESSEQALELCRTQRFEAILSDVTMPGMDGLEFCRSLRGTPNERTPVAFLSALRADDDAVLKWMEAGALDYLSKPCPPVELATKLGVMVRLSRQQNVLAENERREALLAVAGGAAHELSQPLAAARILLDRMERRNVPPSPEQMAQLRELLDRTAGILAQIQGLTTYVTKPYATGRIMDIEKSHEASGNHPPLEPDGAPSE